ncbi:hypothetical protein Taro_020699 [Colocasia esculenta]|uniref:IBH1-like N-terminal domain-containing protein n=1 Tax=Colocasia esculenta TaxID=4460 RepID=A0A843V603_COLES|nr:hypothetical protein [Colocasia esculenta]
MCRQLLAGRGAGPHRELCKASATATDAAFSAVTASTNCFDRTRGKGKAEWRNDGPLSILPSTTAIPQHSRCLKWCPAESASSNTGVTRTLPPGSALMEEQGSKRKRVYPFEPNMALLANFSHEYLAHLLPALVKIGGIRSCGRGAEEKEEMEKMVMFQVNMALAASASGFAWSRALRQKLEGGMKVEKLPTIMATSTLPPTCRQKNAFDMKELWALPPRITRPLAPTQNSHMDVSTHVGMRKAVKPRRARRTSTSKRKLPTEDQELHGGIRTLRRILPGGDDMGVLQLLSEVGSYVICLELQVNILRSLLGAQEQSH